jgi:acyl carrier protein
MNTTTLNNTSPNKRIQNKSEAHDDDITFIVKDIIMYKLGLDESQLIESANFQDDLGIDSLDMIELQMELEKKFDITIKDEEAERLRKVGDVIQFIKNKK